MSKQIIIKCTRLNRYLAFGFAGTSLLLVLVYCKSQTPVQVQAPETPANGKSIVQPFNDVEFRAAVQKIAATNDSQSTAFINRFISSQKPSINFRLYQQICELDKNGSDPAAAIYSIKNAMIQSAANQGFNVPDALAHDYASAMNGAVINIGCNRTEPQIDNPNGDYNDVPIVTFAPITKSLRNTHSTLRDRPIVPDAKKTIDNVVMEYKSIGEIVVTASAEMPDGTWFYVPSDRGWIHESQVR